MKRILHYNYSSLIFLSLIWMQKGHYLTVLPEKYYTRNTTDARSGEFS